jgi:hypothetical protein
MALAWTLGPALIVAGRGVGRLARLEDGRFLGLLMALAAVPALGAHLLVHFGVPGWSFHYVPALIVLAAIGVEKARPREPSGRSPATQHGWIHREPAALRLLAMAGALTALFWLYPTDYSQPGWRGSFDLSFSRFTRTGLKTPIPDRSPEYWRTTNSRPLAGTPYQRAGTRQSGSG